LFGDIFLSKNTEISYKIISPNFWVGIRNISDYSPFGVLLKERTMESEFFRMSFQGQERDDEVKGDGNTINFKFRGYDPRTGRFRQIDPLAGQYPHNSSYAFSENVVINAIELEGLEKVILSSTGEELTPDQTKQVFGSANYDPKSEVVYKIDEFMGSSPDRDVDLTTASWSGLEKLDISYTDFKFLAGVVKDEDAGSLKGSNSIAAAFLNNNAFANANGHDYTLRQTINSISTVSNKTSVDMANLDAQDKIAVRGTLLALTGVDYSNGATHWDGYDFAGKGTTHVKVVNQGVVIQKSHAQSFVKVWSKTGLLSAFSGGKYKSVSSSLTFSGTSLTKAATSENTGRVLFKSTAQHGKSIFWGPNINATQNEGYDWKYFIHY
jgi:RHS repeat-associated protein